MQLLAYLIVYPILWFISKLPFPIFYLFSDISFVLVYHIIGYRKKTVTENLKLAFPKKSDNEINTIRKKFYKHMCDMFLEMIKTLSISDKEMHKRFNYTNLEVIQGIEQRKSVIVMFSHYASWEWTIILQRSIQAKGFGVYKQIKNPYFDKLVRKIRAKYDTTLITNKETIGTVLGNHRKDIRSLYGFISDQTPKLNKAYHWRPFMGVNVPVFTGAEMLAKKCDLAVCYLKVEKIKRGYYQGTFIPLADNAKDFADYQITDKFLDEVEKQINEAPEYYFWTHKRWKHRGKEPK